MIKHCEEIVKAQKELKEAKTRYADEIIIIQDQCDHPIILERSSGVTQYEYIENRWFPAVRVCARCGYVEESQYGWPTNKTMDTPLYNTNPESKSRLNRMDFSIEQDRLYREIVSRD